MRIPGTGEGPVISRHTFRRSLARSLAAAFITIAATGAVCMPASASPQDYTDQYAKDRAEIEDLMARYLFAMDYNDFDAYVATFTEDGELEFASGSAVGRDAIRKIAMQFKDRIGSIYVDADGEPAILRHVLAQTVIRVEGDRAWARAFWYEMANDGPKNEAGRKGLKMGTFGIYEDELRKVDGEWLFSKRRILNEFLDGRHSGPGNPVAEMDAASAKPE